VRTVALLVSTLPALSCLLCVLHQPHCWQQRLFPSAPASPAPCSTAASRAWELLCVGCALGRMMSHCTITHDTLMPALVGTSWRWPPVSCLQPRVIPAFLMGSIFTMHGFLSAALHICRRASLRAPRGDAAVIATCMLHCYSAPCACWQAQRPMSLLSGNVLVACCCMPECSAGLTAFVRVSANRSPLNGSADATHGTRYTAFYRLLQT
jgi:hypothetical protein